MVIIFKKGQKIDPKNIFSFGGIGMLFILVLLEGDTYVFVASDENFHRDCLALLKEYRKDLKIVSVEGGGNFVVSPASHSERAKDYLGFWGESSQYGEADPDVVGQLLTEAFPEAEVDG